MIGLACGKAATYVEIGSPPQPGSQLIQHSQYDGVNDSASPLGLWLAKGQETAN